MFSTFGKAGERTINVEQASSVMSKDNDKDSYLRILLQQYSECCADIRNFDTQIWQIPTYLLAIVSILGVAYSQLRDIPVARVILLLVGLGSTLVSMVALFKHRFFCDRRVDHIEKYLQEELKSLLPKEYAERFKEVRRKSKDLAPPYSIHRVSAYDWQRGFVITVLIGIALLLLSEFVRFVATYR